MDQDEVDDFLDEIVETLAKLQDEKEELLAKLEQMNGTVAPISKLRSFTVSF